MANPSPITKIFQYLPIMEGICLAAFAVGFTINFLNKLSGQEIIIFSLGTLSGIYYLRGFIPREQPNDEGKQQQPQGFTALLGRTIAPKILSIGSSVTVIGILFAIQHWNGFREMLLIGCTSLAASSLLGLVTTMNDEQARQPIGKMLARAVPLMLIGIYLFMTYGLSAPAV